MKYIQLIFVTLLVLMSIPTLALNDKQTDTQTVETEQATLNPPSDKTEIPLLARDAIQYRGTINPEEFPSFALMRPFIHSLVNQYEGEFGELFVDLTFQKMGLNQTSIDALNQYAIDVMADYEILFNKNVICSVFEHNGKATTKAQLANAINQHDFNRRNMFTIAYDNLNQILAPEELKKFQHYLKTEYVEGISYVHSKPLKAKDVDKAKLKEMCVRKGFIQ